MRVSAATEEKLREAMARATEPQGRLDAFATVTANLCHENLELKKKTSRQGQRRTALPVPGPWLEQFCRHRSRDESPGAVT